MDLQQLEPSLQDRPWVSAQDAKASPDGWAAGVLSHYARTPLEYRTSGGDTAILNHLWTNDIGAQWRHGDLAIGAGLPIHALATGLSTPDPRWLGDTRLSSTLALPSLGGPLDIGLSGALGLPTGNSDGWLGEPGIHGSGHLLVSGGSSLRWTMNVGGIWRPRTDLGELTWGPAVSWRAGAMTSVSEALSVGLELDGASQVLRSDAPGAHPVETLASLQWQASESLSLTTGGAAALTKGVGAPAYRAMLGLTWSHHAPSKKATATIQDTPVAAPPEPSAAQPEPTPPGETKPVSTAVNVSVDVAKLLKTQIYFQPGSAQISLAANAALTELALVLIDHPELGKIEVQGFAGAQSAQASNLSLQRAEAVMVWLVEHGVAPSRLSARGYGAGPQSETQSPNEKERVELHQVLPNPPSEQ